MVDLELEFCCCWGFLAGGHRIFRITVRAKVTLSALNLGVSPAKNETTCETNHDLL